MLDEQTRAQLHDLLALFGASRRAAPVPWSGQLLRPDHAIDQREPSLSETAYQAIVALEELEAVEALLAALGRRSPDRGRRHPRVAGRAGIGQTGRPTAGGAPHGSEPPPGRSGGENVSPEVAAFALELTAGWTRWRSPRRRPALDPDHWPWTAVAAVLGSFGRARLRPLPGTRPGSPALVALADYLHQLRRQLGAAA